jgi:hypothetical protein
MNRFAQYARMPANKRRPGFEGICRKIARKHPLWSDETVVAEAKVQWHRENPTT